MSESVIAFTYKAATWIDMDDCFGIQILLRDNFVDDFRQDFGAQFLEANLVRVLNRHDDGVNSLRNASSILEFIFACDLQWMKRRVIYFMMSAHFKARYQQAQFELVLNDFHIQLKFVDHVDQKIFECIFTSL